MISADTFALFSVGVLPPPRPAFTIEVSEESIGPFTIEYNGERFTYRPLSSPRYHIVDVPTEILAERRIHPQGAKRRRKW